MKKKKSYKNFDRITKVLHGHTIFFLQPELSQSESYVQGPSPSAQGFEEEHLEIQINSVVCPRVFDPDTKQIQIKTQI